MAAIVGTTQPVWEKQRMKRKKNFFVHTVQYVSLLCGVILTHNVS
jgi:hypothetical protein